MRAPLLALALLACAPTPDPSSDPDTAELVRLAAAARDALTLQLYPIPPRSLADLGLGGPGIASAIHYEDPAKFVLVVTDWRRKCTVDGMDERIRCSE